MADPNHTLVYEQSLRLFGANGPVTIYEQSLRIFGTLEAPNVVGASMWVWSGEEWIPVTPPPIL